jgi:predicted DNA-binding transcriptional regulator AlpA
MAYTKKSALPAPELLTLSEVLSTFPVSRSLWYRGVHEGRYPRPVRLSARRVAWRRTDIENLSRQAWERAHG